MLQDIYLGRNSKMHPKFQRIILYARQHHANHAVNETVQRLIDFLTRQQFEIYTDYSTASQFSLELPILEYTQMGQKHDLLVVVGGDGSLLAAIRIAMEVNLPVIGINLGRLGFLTDISPQEIDNKLYAVINGEYREEIRFLLQAQLYDRDKTDILFHGDALNDVVLHRGHETHLVEFEMYINQQYVCHYRSDGLIIATPTGSTAYSLSAGGPIMHPKLNAMVIVPMFSHSLNSRPLVIDGQANIDLFISQNNIYPLRLSCDGQESLMVKAAQQIRVERNNKQLRLLHPIDYNYYDTLRIKLGWQSKNNLTS